MQDRSNELRALDHEKRPDKRDSYQPINVAMRVTRDLRRRLWCAELCLPRLALRPPAGPGWIHEIKHDGFRILAKRSPDGVHLFTRKGYDLGVRFTLVATAVAARHVRASLTVKRSPATRMASRSSR
jgi:hypothetical protein